MGNMGTRLMPFYDRVMDRLILTDDGCLEFQGSRTPFGYGKIKPRKGSPLTAHRVVYEHVTGTTLTDGEIIMHTCDNPPCCNILHLRKGTKADNTADMVAKERTSHGESHWNHKLTEDQIREIRTDTRSQRELGKVYGVAHSSIWKIKNKVQWKEVQ